MTPPVASHLDDLESGSLYVLREALSCLAPICMLWSMGKDSTALLWMARKAFFGKIPFPVVQLDTEMELPEVYEFRDQIAKEWNLDLRVELCPPESSTDPSLAPASRAAARKTEGLKNVLERDQFAGVIVGIRRDDGSTREARRSFLRADSRFRAAAGR